MTVLFRDGPLTIDLTACFISYQENIDTPTGELIFHVMG